MIDMLAQSSKLLLNKRGAVAGIVALFMPVMIGGMAFGIDIASYRIVHSRLQAAVDAGALAGLMQVDTGGVTDKAIAVVDGNVPDDFGAITAASDVETGTWTKDGGFTPAVGPTVNAVRVTALRSPERGNGVGRIFSIFWGPQQATIGATAIAARPQNVFYQPPEGTTLDPEAGDFNEMYAYCFNTETSERTQMTLISNNLPGGQKITDIATGAPDKAELNLQDPVTPMAWPDCSAKGQTLSFRMRNIRHAKGNPGLWADSNMTIDGRQPGRPVHDYYTDTQISDGTETFASSSAAILETVRCDTAEECQPAADNDKIPYKKKNRSPERAAQGCAPGKWMYFGWEDRNGSTNSGSWMDADWTDKDYDDIRISMKCPNSGKLGDPWGRLVS